MDDAGSQPGHGRPVCDPHLKSRHHSMFAVSQGCPALLLAIHGPAALVLPVRHLWLLFFEQAKKSNLLSVSHRHK